MKIDKKHKGVDNLEEFNLSELEYQEGEKKIKVSRASKGVVSQNISDKLVSSNKAVLKNDEQVDGTRIKSPIIGTAYLAPEPGGKKFAQVGESIKKGQTIMIVEAMKTMNHIPSPSDGVVKKYWLTMDNLLNLVKLL